MTNHTRFNCFNVLHWDKELGPVASEMELEMENALCKCGHPKSDHEPGYACSGVLPVPYGEDLVEWCQCTVFTPKQSNDGQEER